MYVPMRTSASAEKTSSHLYENEYLEAVSESTSISALTLATVALVVAFLSILVAIPGLVNSSISVSDINSGALCCNNNNLIPDPGIIITPNANGTITLGLNQSYISSLITSLCCNNSNSSAGGVVDSVVAGTYISVDSTDPHNPIVSSTANLTNIFTTTTVTITAADIASSAKVTVFTAGPGEIYIVDAIYSPKSSAVNFDSGGNCNLNIQAGLQGANVRYNAATLKALTSWPDALIVASDASTSFFYFTVSPGGSIQAFTGGGCTDYVSGQLDITLQLMDVSSSFFN